MSGPIGASAGETPVTARQLEVLRIIERSIEARGFPPTIREFTIELGLSLKSRQSIEEYLARLAAKGMLVRHARAARGITLTAAARELLARERANLPEQPNQ
jgi:repressor LexA